MRDVRGDRPKPPHHSALAWSVIVNGVISVPIMAVMTGLGQSREVMGEH